MPILSQQARLLHQCRIETSRKIASWLAGLCMWHLQRCLQYKSSAEKSQVKQTRSFVYIKCKICEFGILLFLRLAAEKYNICAKHVNKKLWIKSIKLNRKTSDFRILVVIKRRCKDESIREHCRLLHKLPSDWSLHIRVQMKQHRSVCHSRDSAVVHLKENVDLIELYHDIDLKSYLSHPEKLNTNVCIRWVMKYFPSS